MITLITPFLQPRRRQVFAKKILREPRIINMLARRNEHLLMVTTLQIFCQYKRIRGILFDRGCWCQRMNKTDFSLSPCLTPNELITAELVLVPPLSLHQAPAPCHVSPIDCCWTKHKTWGWIVSRGDTAVYRRQSATGLFFHDQYFARESPCGIYYLSSGLFVFGW